MAAKDEAKLTPRRKRERLLYAHEEDLKLLNYIIDNNHYYDLRGTQMWKNMEVHFMHERTWWSLRTRGIHSVIPSIFKYRIPGEAKQEITKGFAATARKKKQ